MSTGPHRPDYPKNYDNIEFEACFAVNLATLFVRPAHCLSLLSALLDFEWFLKHFQAFDLVRQ